jgi:hypothetical protein
VARNAKSSIIAMMKINKKLEFAKNDPELFMLPAFPSLGLLGTFLGLYMPKKLHKFFVNSLM